MREIRAGLGYFSKAPRKVPRQKTVAVLTPQHLSHSHTPQHLHRTTYTTTPTPHHAHQRTCTVSIIFDLFFLPRVGLAGLGGMHPSAGIVRVEALSLWRTLSLFSAGGSTGAHFAERTAKASSSTNACLAYTTATAPRLITYTAQSTPQQLPRSHTPRHLYRAHTPHQYTTAPIPLTYPRTPAPRTTATS